MTQIWGQNERGQRGIIKAYRNARKLFQLSTLPIGVMTYGIGNLGSRSIQGLVRDFSSDYTGNADVKSASQKLYDFFRAAYQEQFGDADEARLGFFVAGYSREKPFPEEWEFLLPRDQESLQVRSIDAFGASWRGVSIPFTRLYQGYDPRTVEELTKLGVSEEDINKTVKRWASPVVYDAMPVQDAVNFTAFILRTTIGLSSFEIGDPSCGGPLQIAAILPDRGFSWIREPVLTVTG